VRLLFKQLATEYVSPYSSLGVEPNDKSPQKSFVDNTRSTFEDMRTLWSYLKDGHN
jgi:hypothetical protein